MEFKVSVIIPVFNAEQFVADAVESAVKLEEVAEVILVEDGSPDGSLQVCMELSERYSKVKLFVHPGNINKGVSASRNLGIINSKYLFIAFLDADDVYLANRFKSASAKFEEGFDGVYDSTKNVFISELAKARFENAKGRKLQDESIIAARKDLVGKEILRSFLLGQSVVASCAITLRRSCLIMLGMFDENLTNGEDYLMWLKCIYHFKWTEGDLDVPVALRRVLETSAEAKESIAKTHSKYRHTWDYFKNKSIPFGLKFDLYKRLIASYPERKHVHSTALLKYGELIGLSIKLGF